MRVEFKNVFKRYGKVLAVDNLNLTLEDGALHFLLGPSGCGKTTILRMLAGLESVSEGQILFDGKDVTALPAAERGIGMVFQNYALWPHMTVQANIEYGLDLKKLPKAEKTSRLEEVLQITQLAQFRDRLPGQLSGGQQQRVALARALAVRPNVLLLDEPLSNLDAKLRHEMRENITRIHKQTGITTLYVTHDQKEALSMGTSITVMRAGKTIQTGSPQGLYLKPSTPFLAGFIGETNILKGKIMDIVNDRFQVETDIGSFMAAHSMLTGAKIGDRCALSIRPESIKVRMSQGEEEPQYNPMKLTLESLTYLGESEQLLLSGSGVSIKANVFNPSLHKPSEGEVLAVGVHPDHVLVLCEENDLTSGT